MRYALGFLILFLTACPAPNHHFIKNDEDVFSKTGNEIFRVKVHCQNLLFTLQLQTTSSQPQSINLSTLVKSAVLKKYAYFNKDSSLWPLFENQDSIIQLRKGDILEVLYEIKSYATDDSYTIEIQKPFINNPKIICEYKKK